VVWKIGIGFRNKSFDAVVFSDKTWYLLPIIVLLMVLNWAVEALKWKILIKNLKPLRFKEAFAAVLAGVSTGIITPNRIGNFIGRTVLLDKEIKIKATLLTLLANLSQFVVTLFFGCVGLLLLGGTYLQNAQIVLIFVGIFTLGVGLAVYINPLLINRRPFNFFFSDKIIDGITFISATKIQLKLRIIGLSALRYLVFVTQYVLLLIAFDQQESILLFYGSIMVVYLLMTLIPSLFFGKLFVREAAALFVLNQIGIPDAIILITGFLMWLINIALPSLVGAGVLMSKK